MTPEGELIVAAVADFRRHVENVHGDCLTCHTRVTTAIDAMTDWINRPQPIQHRDVVDTFAASLHIFGTNGNGKHKK